MGGKRKTAERARYGRLWQSGEPPACELEDAVMMGQLKIHVCRFWRKNLRDVDDEAG